MKPYKHQQKIVDLNPAKHLLAHDMGTGKTVTSIILATNNARSVLVVCPKQMKQQWHDAIMVWAPQNKEQWLVLTKEEFKKQENDLDARECLIVDEAHNHAGMRNAKHRSQLLKSTVRYIKRNKPSYIYLLTGTPYLSTPWNIYAYAVMLGYKWNYREFRDKYFIERPLGHRTITEPRPGIEKEMRRLVNEIGSTVSLDECVDMPKAVEQIEYYKLTREQKQAIEEIEDVQHIVRWTKIHQLCGGALKGNEYEDDLFVPCEKIKRVKELVKEQKKIAIVCRYNNELEMLARELEKCKRPIYIINGSNSSERAAQCARIENSEQAVVLVQAACSEGYELPSIPVMVFYSHDFSLKNYLQMKGRTRRMNRPAPRVYISLVIKDSIDEDVYKNVVINKQDFHLEIFAKK